MAEDDITVHDVEEAPATPAGSRHVKAVDAKALIQGMLQFTTIVMSECCNAKVAETAIKKAMKAPAVKAMLGRIKPKGVNKAPCAVRSTYNVFVMVCMHFLKAAGVDTSMIEVSSVWTGLPADIKAHLNNRYNAAKDAYNTKLAEGAEANLVQELTAYEEQHKLAPTDYIKLVQTYKGAAAPAANGSSKPGATATAIATAIVKPPVAAAAAAAAPAVEAAAADVDPAEGEGKNTKKHKRDKGAGAGTNTAKKERKKKHKKGKGNAETAA